MNATFLQQSAIFGANTPYCFYVPQSKQDATKREAIKKTKSALLSSKLNSAASAIAAFAEVSPIPYTSSMALAARVLSKAVAAFGYSKSTSRAQNEPCMLKNYNMMTTSGVEEAQKFTLNGDTTVSKSPSNFGDMMDFDLVSNFARNPRAC